MHLQFRKLNIFGTIFLLSLLTSFISIGCDSASPNSADSIGETPLRPRATHTPPLSTATPVFIETATATLTVTPIPSTTPVGTATLTAEPTISASPTPFSLLTVSRNANIRSGPGTEFPVAGSAREGESLPVYGRSENGWYQVDPSGEMWIGGSLVTVQVSPSDIPFASAMTETPAAPVASASSPTPSPSLLTVEQIFAGKTAFTYAGAEDINFNSIQLDKFLTDSILFRYYLTEGTSPSDLYKDICPGEYTTVWYAFEASGNGRISFGFSIEVRPDLTDRSTWFLPIFMDEYREAVGNPKFRPPLYLTYCTREEYSHSHTIFVDNEDFSNLNRQVNCKIAVNRGGQEQILHESSSTGGTAMCWHTDS
jgi:hypothetical protein